MTFEIHEAKRVGARLLIQLSGVSGSGKTYTALQLAYGLAGEDASKIIGIDTENRRMSLNADCLPDRARFRVCDFYAPFSPARYINAIDACIKAGAEVIVIDSVTHEWESEGGCEWIATSATGKLPDWKRAKAEHKRFMTYMLQCPAHIICCTRAREKTDFTNPKEPQSLGIQPIQEKNFSYEATVSLMMRDSGARQDVLKCPAELARILGRGRNYLTAKDGAALREWVDGAEPINPQAERARGVLQNAASAGVKALAAAYDSVPPAVRGLLSDTFIESVRASAEAYDRERVRKPDESEAAAELRSLSGQADNLPDRILAAVSGIHDPTALANARRRADALRSEGKLADDDHAKIIKAINDRDQSLGQLQEVQDA